MDLDVALAEVMDQLDKLPAKVRNTAREMRELDAKNEELYKNIRTNLHAYTKDKGRMPHHEKKRRLAEIDKMYADAEKLGEAKVKLASKLYNSIDGEIRTMDKKTEAAGRLQARSRKNSGGGTSNGGRSLARRKGERTEENIEEEEEEEEEADMDVPMPIDPNEPIYCSCHQPHQEQSSAVNPSPLPAEMDKESFLCTSNENFDSRMVDQQTVENHTISASTEPQVLEGMRDFFDDIARWTGPFHPAPSVGSRGNQERGGIAQDTPALLSSMYSEGHKFDFDPATMVDFGVAMGATRSSSNCSSPIDWAFGSGEEEMEEVEEFETIEMVEEKAVKEVKEEELKIEVEEETPPMLSPEPSPVKFQPSFKEISSPIKCANPRVREKVRRYDKEPTAAGKRYLKPMDKLRNSYSHQVQTQIKFYKHRVEDWVAQSTEWDDFPLEMEMMEMVELPRRYSDPIFDVAPDCENLIVHEQPAVEISKAEAVFERMLFWMEKWEWALEDEARIDFPREGSLIRVRVVNVRGREATVVPARDFDRVAETLREYIISRRPARMWDRANREALVVLEQESDTIGVNEYRRGWMFEGNSEDVSVLLIDERRIVRVPRSSLFTADSIIVACGPPLCVSAHFQREVMAHELDLLLLGCAAECRVMEKKKGVEEDRLELSLEMIDTWEVTLDVMFCSEECAGACAYHQDEKKRK